MYSYVKHIYLYNIYLFQTDILGLTDFDEILFQSTPKPDALVQIQHSNSNNDAGI